MNGLSCAKGFTRIMKLFAILRGWACKKMDVSIILFNGFLMLGFVVATVPDVMVLGSSGSTLVMEQEIPYKKCRYSRAYSMLQIQCSNIGLSEIPPDLKTDIQILDISVNRLRELTNESLAAYKSLTYIYMGDNFIQNIQEAAFANQHYLEVLDLSTNGCEELPKSLFQLPYLRKLYVSHNRLTDATLKLEVRSPLNFLDLSKNKLSRIPEIGPLPTLANLNVSENLISAVTSEDLAQFCSLKVLDLSKNPIKFNGNTCECQAFNGWLVERGIRSKPSSFNCTQQPDCASFEYTNRTMELYGRCMSILQLRVETEKARKTWILVACCVSGFIICIFVWLFCIHKRNKRRRRKLKEQQQLAANNANTELLNGNLSRDQNT